MNINDPIFNKIAQALLVDYSSVYYVNAVTDEYWWYSIEHDTNTLEFVHSGENFFDKLSLHTDEMIYEPDKHIIMKYVQKSDLLAQMKKGAIQNTEIRIMIDGEPVYHSLRLIRGLSDDDDYFILGVINVDKQVRARKKVRKVEKEREIFNQIASSLAEHYDTLYYIDVNTNHYFEYSSTEIYKSLQVPTTGDDFFTESRKNIRKYVHPDDRSRVLEIYYKDAMLKNLENKTTFSTTYRLMISGNVMHCRCSQIWASDKKHIIVCIENINDEVLFKEELKQSQKTTITYVQIAQSLVSKYDVIYYIDSTNGKYAEFTANSLHADIQQQDGGEDFFADAEKNIEQIVHPNDKERVNNALSRDYLITALDSKKQFIMNYRLVIDRKTQYNRMTITWSSDRVHLIIGVENINDEVRKEKDQIKALKLANEMSRRDELTGVKNKKAYHELEEYVQGNIDNNTQQTPFALVVCDINNLKLVNDTQGHKAGDDYIRASCRLICNVFTHSKVFRIGGDEFVAFLGSSDYNDRAILMEKLHRTVLQNLNNGEGPVVAAGIADYEEGKDLKVSDVFVRADKKMYDEKKRLKELNEGIGSPGTHNVYACIPQDRKKKLEGLFGAFSIVAQDAYVYICDMKYDYSIWSKTAVDTFGLPGDHMYKAGDIWEENIHPDDRDKYHSGINAIFTGDESGHDMQYRARKINGEYDVCTCRGIVLRDENGAPDYFCGAIRNHGAHSNVDELTGMRNQYGFFEDLQSLMIKNTHLRIYMIGISKLSEINNLYGYNFGNKVLQKFGRSLLEHIGSEDNTYRLDGTKFAVLSTSHTLIEMQEKYADLRKWCRESFNVDDKQLIIELNAGFMAVDSFNIDYQTIYACLNYAYSESKIKRHGDPVEFDNTQGNDNKHRIELLHTIRASITQQFKGFYLLYQPVVDAISQKLIGGEALLRWKNDEYGVVTPDRFIPVLEKDPMFCLLGEWILKSALRDAKEVLETEPNFIVNVNLSYTQIEKTDFVDTVVSALKKADFPPENLCLEITERCRLLDLDLLKSVIEKLRAMGIKIALDDYGTGFSSISLVKNIKFDIIKIDSSFVRRIEQDDTEGKLLQHFSNLAGIFSTSICVEGIETAKIRDIVQDYKVSSLQGYYYAKPLPLDEFIDWKHKEE